ncbi:MAG TPA: glycosyltransferase family 4 protein, partial [Oligoflexia bacterium]|nr:glycosyltransferase family 4 protein [Oligoflexia bacterium]
IAAAWLRIRTVVVFQLAPQKIAIGSLKLKTYRWAHNRSQQWAAVSKHNQASLCRTFGLAPKEVAVIYNGVSLPQAAAAETAKTKLREELGVLPDEAMVLTIARLDPLKGHEILVPAIAKIVKKHPRVKFFWIGDGTLRSALQNLVVSYGLLGKVVFSGFRTDVADLLDAAQLFVHPSEREGFSFAILEAMAHKVPIVAADSTSIPEVIENQVHGLLFRSGDSCDLLEKIDWALSNNQAMQEMAERAYVHVMKFPEKEMIEHHLHFLQRHELAQTTS